MDSRTEPATAEPVLEKYYPVSASIAAAKRAIPRVYRITDLPAHFKDEFSFIVLGCQGSKLDKDVAQRQTAELMANKGTKLAFFLGDNFYDYGIDSPIDPIVNKRFKSVYPMDFKNIVLRGNHDRAEQNFAKTAYHQVVKWMPTGDEPSFNQIAITYYSTNEAQHHHKVALYEKTEIKYDDLNTWVMPSLFDSFIIHETQFFCLDSSAYLGAFLELMDYEGQDIDEHHPAWNNQAVWTQRVFLDAVKNKLQTFLMLHHPLVNIGKRDFPDEFDTQHYISAAAIRKLCRYLKERYPDFVPTDSLGELLQAVLLHQGIEPDCFYNAHEHLLANIHLINNPLVNVNNPDADESKPKRVRTKVLRQFTSGGGCSDWHARFSLRYHPEVGFNEEDSGIVVVTCPAKNNNTFRQDVYTLRGLHLHFKQDSQFPIVADHPDKQVMILRTAVLAACNQFLTILREKEMAWRSAYPHVLSLEEPMLGWLSDGVTYATSAVRGKISHVFRDKKLEALIRTIQNIQSYFNQHQMPDLKACLQMLYDATLSLPKDRHINDATEPFYGYLMTHIQALMRATLDELCTSYEVEIAAKPLTLAMSH